MLALRFTAPGRNDRDIFYEMNLDLEGIFVADAGYVSKALEKKFYQEGKGILFTKERSNMKRVIDAFQYHLHNTRVQIELNFRNLKMFHGLVTSLLRSIDGYLSSYIYAPTSFTLV